MLWTQSSHSQRTVPAGSLHDSLLWPCLLLISLHRDQATLLSPTICLITSDHDRTPQWRLLYAMLHVLLLWLCHLSIRKKMPRTVAQAETKAIDSSEIKYILILKSTLGKCNKRWHCWTLLFMVLTSQICPFSRICHSLLLWPVFSSRTPPNSHPTVSTVFILYGTVHLPIYRFFVLLQTLGSGLCLGC